MSTLINNFDGLQNADNASGSPWFQVVLPADIDTIPDRILDQIGSAITLNGGATAYNIMATVGTVQWQETTQQVNGRQQYISTFSFVIPKDRADVLNYAQHLNNKGVVAIVRDANGQNRLMGTKAEPATFRMASRGLGTPQNGRNEHRYEIVLTSPKPVPFYEVTSHLPAPSNVCPPNPSLAISCYSDAGLTIPISSATFDNTVYIKIEPTGITPTEYTITFDGDLVTAATTASSTYAWTVDTFGSITIYAQAKDASNNSASDSTPLSFTGNLDVDAQNYIDVLSSVSVNEKIKIHELVTTLKSGGVWSKLYSLYPVFSDNAADQKWNMIDPQDLDASYRLTYGGGLYNSRVGINGNNSNAYADTHFNPSNDYLSVSDASLGVYSYSSNVGNKCATGVGLIFTVQNGIMIHPSFTGTYYANAFGASFGSVANANASGLFVVTRGSSTQFSFHKRGSSTIDQTVVTGLSAIPNGNIWLCAGNPTSGSPSNAYSSALIGYAFIGKHLTTSEIDTIHSAFNDFKSCG